MSHKYLYYSLISILVFILLLGIFILNYSKGESDASKFKKEYEDKNNTNIKVEIDKNNPFLYRNEEQIKKILKNNTGMIFIGNAKSDSSRMALNFILPLIKENDVKKIFYLDNSNLKDKDLIELNDNKVAIIFVIAGEVEATFTTNDIENASIMGRSIKGEINYNMQKTFNEFCDETCDD